MRLDAILDLLLGSPRHDGIDQFVAAAVLELRGGPSQVLQVVDVVGQLRDIVLHVGTGASAGLSRIGREDDGLLHANHRLGSDRGAHLRGMFGWDEIGVVPLAWVAASSSIFGWRAATTTGTGSLGLGAMYSALFIFGRYSFMWL